jgi:D-glycero-D-manno-heptose 1,7-bisphosphate phosphatase
LPDRYHIVDFDGTRISRFNRDRFSGGPSHVNGGVIACSRSIVDHIASPSSLENDVWPALAQAGTLAGLATDGYLLDIGSPAAFKRAQIEIPKRCVRPAAFFDCRVLVGETPAHLTDRLDWADGAIDAIRACNDRGWYVFVVPAQPAAADKACENEDLQRWYHRMNAALAAEGAHIDEFGRCSYCGGGASASCRGATQNIIFDLLKAWQVDKPRSVMICSPDADATESATSGIAQKRFVGGSLIDLLAPRFRAD